MAASSIASRPELVKN